MMKRHSGPGDAKKIAAVIAACFVVACVVTLLVLRRAPEPEAKEAAGHGVAPAVEAAAPAVPPLGDGGVAPLPLVETAAARDWQALIDSALAATAAGPERARTFVLQLFAALDGLSPADRLSTLLAFMESGRDARLGKAFKPGAGGYLTEWPTLRVALIDYLSQRDSVAARLLAEEILETRAGDPGEWSLALRELVRGVRFEELPETVVERMHDFLRDPEWSAGSQPSWLEGFDVVVATRSPTYLPDLSTITTGTSSSRAAQFAAFLTADRLALAAPREMLAALNNNAGLFNTEPTLRAGLFARADVRDLEQASQLEAYFQRPDIPAEERAAFADLFPLYDLAVSQNLLTQPASRSMHDMIAHDRAAVALIDRWLGDPRFGKWHGTLRQVRERLSGQLAQVGR